MEASKFKGNHEKSNLNVFIESFTAYLKSLLETDIMLFLLSFFAALTNAVSFSNSLKRSKICLMFAKMFELKRVVIPGPAFLCNFYVLSSFTVVFFCLWFFLRVHVNNSIYR